MRRRLLCGFAAAGLILALINSPASAAKGDYEKAGNLCESNGGDFIDLDGVAYVCMLPTAATVTHVLQAGTLCVRQGGLLYAAVGNVAGRAVLR